MTTILSYGNTSNYIDVAVMNQSLDGVAVRDSNLNVTHLDKIPISSTMFQTIFYGSGNKFLLNPINKTNVDILPYISLQGSHVTVCGCKFSLVNTIYDNLENDLNVTRDMFESSSTIALNYTLSNILSLYDISNGVPSCSLDWSNIMNIVQEIYNGKLKANDPNPPSTVVVNLVISIVITTPTVGSYPTVIKFIYETTFQMA